MRSSFTRRGAAPARDPGTRAGLNGTTLVSMGLVDLDRIIGGGLPLGTVLLLLEDPHSNQHLHIVKYFLSEGIACGHSVRWVLPEEPLGGAAAWLPAQAAPSSSSSSPQDADEGAGGGAGTELRIAWQYRKYLQPHQRTRGAAASASGHPSSSGSSRSSSSGPGGMAAGASVAGGSFRPGAGGGALAGPRAIVEGAAAPAARGAARGSRPGAAEAGVARQWCRSYDLTRPLGQEALGAAALECCPLGAAGGGLPAAVGACREFVQRFVEPEPAPLAAAGVPVSSVSGRGPEAVARLVVQGLGSARWGPACSSSGANAGRQLLRAVVAVRQLVQRARCAALITCNAGALPPDDALRLQHACDAVLSLEALTDDAPLMKFLPDSPSAAALLEVRKLPAVGLPGPRLPEAVLHIVRHKRRRITIQMIEFDPDAEEGQAAAGGGKSAAALLCAGPPAAPSAALDF